jgi:redox-sensitive bicupin YhaK (pirin superfamily)
VPVTATGPARVLLLGGAPFPEPLIMWWNFVARTHEEIDAAVRDWQGRDERFGEVASRLPRIPAPAPLWAPRA